MFEEAGPRRVRGVTIDVTERRRAREQFEAAMKMQADFVNFASHQLRTPLTGIKWMLELAMGEDEGSADMRGFVADSLAASERLIVLVNDLLSVSRLGRRPRRRHRDALRPRAADAGRARRHPAARAQVQSPAHGHGPRRRPRGRWATRQLLRQVLQNLVSNAIEYHAARRPHRRRITSDGAEVRCAVTDTGIGVPEAARPRLFEKFFRADNVSTVETEGTGLGLYIVRLIVERAHGRIWFEPAETGGSRFLIALPLATTSEAAPAHAVPSTPPARFPCRLHASCSPKTTASSARPPRPCSSGADSPCITAADGEEALRLARESAPDLMLLDLVMPKMHGFDVLAALKAAPETAGIR